MTNGRLCRCPNTQRDGMQCSKHVFAGQATLVTSQALLASRSLGPVGMVGSLARAQSNGFCEGVERIAEAALLLRRGAGIVLPTSTVHFLVMPPH